LSLGIDEKVSLFLHRWISDRGVASARGRRHSTMERRASGEVPEELTASAAYPTT
jgi:hypothetical protein